MSTSTTLYYAKVNLNSSHIFEVYDKVYELKDILMKLYESVSDNLKHERVDTYQGEEIYKAIYAFENIRKLENEFCIYGELTKSAPVFVKQRDNQNKLVKVAVDNEESVKFFFDVIKETVVFYTSNRFGYVEIIEALQRLINTCINEKYGGDDEFYHFNVSLIRGNLNIDNIKSELNKLKNIESIKIDIIPPNPDPSILEEIQKNGEKRLNDLKNGNVTYKSTLLQSKSSTGIVLNSEIVNTELNEAINLHTKLSSEEALSKGYVQVEATSTEGRTYSTKDKQPIKYTIDKDYANNIEDFISFCKRSIQSLFN
jgi:hypothetical protein